MFPIRHAMKLQHGDTPVPRLVRGALEIVQGPIRARVPRRRDEQRMIDARFVSKAAAPFVRMFGRAAAAGEAKAEFFQNGQRARVNRISRIPETSWPCDAMLRATRVNGFDLFAQFV